MIDQEMFASPKHMAIDEEIFTDVIKGMRIKPILKTRRLTLHYCTDLVSSILLMEFPCAIVLCFILVVVGAMVVTDFAKLILYHLSSL